MKTVILTAGTFDLFHTGHIRILKKAKSKGDMLIVAVSSDELVKSYKGTCPILNYGQRKEIISELKCVDKVVKQTKLVDINQFKRLKATYFVLGDDWKNRYDNEGINWLRDNKKIIWLPYTKNLSTSKIKKQIIDNQDIIKKNLIIREK